MATKDFVFDFEGAANRMGKMADFQLLHNELCKDFTELYDITKSSINDGRNSSGLMRACLKEFFSLMEADIYYINNIEPYQGYNDRDAFIKKFKRTYEFHCKSHEKNDLFNDFFRENMEQINSLKTKRDNITHPKEKQLIQVDIETFETIQIVFRAYTKFVSASMTDTYVGFKTNSLHEGIEAIKRFFENRTNK